MPIRLGSMKEIIALTEAFTTMTEPTGFVDKTAVLSFTPGTLGATRQFTITGAHDIYINGVKTSKTTTSIVIPDVTGLYWIYYDSTGTIQYSATVPSFTSNCFIATVYWNTTTDKYLLGEERHGIKMDVDTHAYLHYTVGTRYESGLTGNFTDTTFSITLGIINDEDLTHSISAQTTCNVLYKNGSANFEWSSASDTPYYTSGGNLYYNNDNTLTAMDANKYVAYWVFATNNTTVPITTIMGQRQDTTLADARVNNKYESLTLGTLPFQEMKLLYRVIYRNDVTPWEETQDLRTVSNLPAGTYLATAHNVLTGLNWSAAGHTWDSNLDFLTYNILTSGTLVVGAATVTSLDAGSGLIQTTGDVQVGDDLLLPNVDSIINFGSGDITLTYTANTLTFAGMTSLDLGTSTLTTDFINLKTLTTPLHITKNEASAEPTWNTSNDIVIIENSTNTSLQLLTAVGGVANLGFSTTATRISGLIQYSHITDSMLFNTALTTRLTLAPTLATFTTNVNMDDNLVVDDDCDIVGDLTAGTIQADNGYDGTIPGPEAGKQMVFLGGILISYETA